MIVAILDVALDALDMLAITAVDIGSLFFHDATSFQNGRFCNDRPITARSLNVERSLFHVQ